MNNALMILVKLALTVLLLPVAWACGVVFHQHVIAFPGAYGEFFLWGVFGFLLLFLFFYQFWAAYEFGQKIILGLFQFVSPANKFISRFVPFYMTVILLFYYAIVNFLGVSNYDHYFMFFAGFAFMMHLLLTAQDLQEQEKTFIKPAYLFTMIMVFILTVCVAVLLFNLAFKEFTFPRFFETMTNHALGIYSRMGERIAFGGAGQV